MVKDDVFKNFFENEVYRYLNNQNIFLVFFFRIVILVDTERLWII